MPQQRDTSTDSLANVIQVIQLGRKSGVLSVERGEGATYEEGAITFVNGQAIQAQTAFFRDQNAFTWLSSWRACRFAFIPEAAPDAGTRSASLQEMARGETSARLPVSPLREAAARDQSDKNYVAHADLPVSLSLVPRHIKPLEESLHLIEQRGFSRQHRRFLLLVDGQRTLAEIARLMGRTHYETQKFLLDLEQAGIVQ